MASTTDTKQAEKNKTLTYSLLVGSLLLMLVLAYPVYRFISRRTRNCNTVDTAPPSPNRVEDLGNRISQNIAKVFSRLSRQISVSPNVSIPENYDFLSADNTPADISNESSLQEVTYASTNRSFE